jgi:hypothetical protein
LLSNSIPKAVRIHEISEMMGLWRQATDFHEEKCPAQPNEAMEP